METALKSKIINKIEQLPKDRIIEVLDFVEFILVKTSRLKTKPVEATDVEVLRAIEASGALDFYYDASQDVYTLDDGKPI
jgi:hypothetical protein